MLGRKLFRIPDEQWHCLGIRDLWPYRPLFETCKVAMGAR